MTITDVRIAGQSVDNVLDARAESSEGDDTGEAIVTLVDSTANRAYNPGDTLIIEWEGGITWTGEVVGRPSQSNGRLTYRALGQAIPLKHEQAFRVFYGVDSGEVVKALVEEAAESLSETEVHTGDTPADWTSVAPVAEPYAGGRTGLYDFGNDMLFIGCRKGHTDQLWATYTDVPTDAIEDGFYELRTRMISPQVAEWSLTIELKTPGGTSYRWEPNLEPGPKTYILPAEGAVQDDSGLSNGELRYRLIPRGTVAKNTGFFLDNASTIPFRTSSRNSSLDAAGVQQTGREITRRVDGSAGAAISNLATEDQAEVYVEDGSLNYIPGTASVDSAKEIKDGSTNVVSVEADRDFESVRNEVLVRGKDGVESVDRDQGSIQAYNRKRPRKVSDPSLVKGDEADARSAGILDNRSRTDASITFNIADISYAILQEGQRIPVDWPDENLNGDYPIVNKTVNSSGIVSITISASTV